jgi:hypothetical protein
MSTRVIDGAYSTLISNIPKNVNARFGAIGVVGNFTSGVKFDSAGTATTQSGTTTDGDWITFGGGGTGIIYQFDSYDQVQKKFGKIYDEDWQSGTITGNGIDPSPWDSRHNAMRSLELIYLANPSVRTYVAILDGSGTSASGASAGAGVAEALAELLKYDDISFVVDGGMNYNTTFQAHVNTASNDTNQAERMYIGGGAIQVVLASGSKVPDLNADEGQFADNDWDSIKQDSGRSVFVAGNVNYTFQCGSGANIREIGGNFFASYVAGLLSRLPEQQSLLRQPVGFAQKYNGSNFRWSRTDQIELVTGRVLHFKQSGGRNVFSRALTHAPTTTDYVRITTRRIVDRVTKEMRATSDAFVGLSNTVINRIGMQTSLDNKLSTLARFGLIQTGSSSNVWVEGTDVADGVVRVSALFKPITEIEFVEVQLTVEI